MANSIVCGAHVLFVLTMTMARTTKITTATITTMINRLITMIFFNSFSRSAWSTVTSAVCIWQKKRCWEWTSD